MKLLLCALAVYKAVQILDALTPKEAMPWVKVLVSTIISFGAAALIGTGNLIIYGFAVATVAGTVHTVLRLLTLLGDRNRRPNR